MLRERRLMISSCCALTEPGATFANTASATGVRFLATPSSQHQQRISTRAPNIRNSSPSWPILILQPCVPIPRPALMTLAIGIQLRKIRQLQLALNCSNHRTVTAPSITFSSRTTPSVLRYILMVLSIISI